MAMHTDLICCVCGENAGTFEQWHNRDTGYGLCAACRDWLPERGMSAEEMRDNYGVEGTHYAARPRMIPGQTPYTAQELAKVERAISDAAEAIERYGDPELDG